MQIQLPDGRWVLPHEHSEPYMLSGYEELMRREAEAYRPATDPVYRDMAGVGSLQWQMQMENQYGAFEQFRGQGAGNMDAMEIL